MVAKMLHAGVEVLQACFKGPCLHRPGNWLVRQLNDEPKPVYIKWDLLERKERLQLEECREAWKLVTHYSGEGWGFYGHFNSGLGDFHWLCISQAFLGELVQLALLLGEGTILRAFTHQPCGRSIRFCISCLGCRNAGFHLLRVQE
jgi:hypothetical protein